MPSAAMLTLAPGWGAWSSPAVTVPCSVVVGAAGADTVAAGAGGAGLGSWARAGVATTDRVITIVVASADTAFMKVTLVVRATLSPRCGAPRRRTTAI